MLMSTNSLLGSTVHAYEGAVGTIIDLLFDATEWTTRYFVVDPKEFLPGKWILVPPVALDQTCSPKQKLQVHCTRQEVGRIRPLTVDGLRSRREEDALYKHFEMHAVVSGGIKLPRNYGIRCVPVHEGRVLTDLHSFSELQSAAVEAVDGTAGTITDVLLEDQHWDEQLLVVGLQTEEGRVAVPVTLAYPVLWEAKTVPVNTSLGAIRNAPEVPEQNTFNWELNEAVTAYYSETDHAQGSQTAQGSR